MSYNRLYPGIISGTVAFMAGYTTLMIDDRLECNTCLSLLITTAKSVPLLDLILLQDRGGLKYPTRQFVELINQIVIVTLDIVECLPKKCKPLDVIKSLLFDSILISAFFQCEIVEHKMMITETILDKLLRTLL